MTIAETTHTIPGISTIVIPPGYYKFFYSIKVGHKDYAVTIHFRMNRTIHMSSGDRDMIAAEESRAPLVRLDAAPYSRACHAADCDHIPDQRGVPVTQNAGAHDLPEPNIIHRSIEDSVESLRQGRLSASIMWEPFLSLVHHQQIGKSIFNEELDLGFMAGVAADERWVQAHEDLTIAYLKAHLLAGRLIREQPNRAAEVLARETGFPSNVIGRAVSKIRWDSALYLNDLKRLNDFNPGGAAGQAAPPGEKSEIRYDTRYLRIAAQELKLPPLPPEGAWRKEIHY